MNPAKRHSAAIYPALARIRLIAAVCLVWGAGTAFAESTPADAGAVMPAEAADPAFWPGKTVRTAASIEGLFSVTTEDGDMAHGYGARASLGCVGILARQLSLDAAVGYRWIEGPDGPIPFPGFLVSGGWQFNPFKPFSLTPFGGLSLEFRAENYSPETVAAVAGGIRFAFLLSGRDYLTLTPSLSVPFTGDASPAVSLALGFRSEWSWMRPVHDERPEVSAKPELFSPDGDGKDDEAVIRLSCEDPSLVSSWTFRIIGNGDSVFMKQEGTGRPPRSIVWDGSGGPVEIEPGVGYRAVFETVDVLGRRSEGETTITCDILVVKDGDRYRVRVPDIIFPSDSWELSPRESRLLLDANRLVLERVAGLFARFPSYSMTVEGYANAVYRGDPAKYAREQRDELMPLSQKRADTVRDALIMLGIDGPRIKTRAWGGERPRAADGSTQNAWKNRRVEFILER